MPERVAARMPTGTWKAPAGVSFVAVPAGLDPEEEASIIALEHGDSAGAVIELCRRGPGATPKPPALAEAIEACPEIEEPPSDPGVDFESGPRRAS